ncbi:hypothetical protein [Nonomuraea sp. NPDC049784]|uniref:hypothetical protein n=1 Tax=Nonomuraea sp. NPDC049784 TaxID=3154361 RepID=UPI0033E2DF4E
MFHVGGARPALYTWAVARQSGDTFVLVSRTPTRPVTGRSVLSEIIDALVAIGISAEDPVFECPYFQSDNATALASSSKSGSEHLGV